MAVPTLSGQFARHLLDLVSELASLSDFGIVEVLLERLKRHLQQSSVYRTLRPRKSESRNQRLAEDSGGGFFESCAEGSRVERLPGHGGVPHHSDQLRVACVLWLLTFLLATGDSQHTATVRSASSPRYRSSAHEHREAFPTHRYPYL